MGRTLVLFVLGCSLIGLGHGEPHSLTSLPFPTKLDFLTVFQQFLALFDILPVSREGGNLRSTGYNGAKTPEASDNDNSRYTAGTSVIDGQSVPAMMQSDLWNVIPENYNIKDLSELFDVMSILDQGKLKAFLGEFWAKNHNNGHFNMQRDTEMLVRGLHSTGMQIVGQNNDSVIAMIKKRLKEAFPQSTWEKHEEEFDAYLRNMGFTFEDITALFDPAAIAAFSGFGGSDALAEISTNIVDTITSILGPITQTGGFLSTTGLSVPSFTSISSKIGSVFPSNTVFKPSGNSYGGKAATYDDSFSSSNLAVLLTFNEAANSIRHFITQAFNEFTLETSEKYETDNAYNTSATDVTAKDVVKQDAEYNVQTYEGERDEAEENRVSEEAHDGNFQQANKKADKKPKVPKKNKSGDKKKGKKIGKKETDTPTHQTMNDQLKIGDVITSGNTAPMTGVKLQGRLQIGSNEH